MKYKLSKALNEYLDAERHYQRELRRDALDDEELETLNDGVEDRMDRLVKVDESVAASVKIELLPTDDG